MESLSSESKSIALDILEDIHESKESRLDHRRKAFAYISIHPLEKCEGYERYHRSSLFRC